MFRAIACVVIVRINDAVDNGKVELLTDGVVHASAECVVPGVRATTKDLLLWSLLDIEN